MIKDINLVISLSYKFFQLVHFGVVSQVATVGATVESRRPAEKRINLFFFSPNKALPQTVNILRYL